MLKALWGMLQSLLLYYKKFYKDIESIGFKINPYDPCMTNCTIQGKQHTVTWHLDNLKLSHINKGVNNKFLEWLYKKYASNTIGEVKAIRGMKHDYLAMVLDFSKLGVLKIDMTEYVKGMIRDFPAELNGRANYPWNNNVFKIDKSSKKLNPDQAKQLHSFTMRVMFVSKQGRQGTLLAVTFLAT